MTVRTGSRRHGVRTEGRKPRSSGSDKTPVSGWTNALFLALALVGSVHVLSMLGVETWRTVNSRQEIARLQTDVAALEDQKTTLQAVTERAGDEVYREQLARCRGFVYPDETRYITLAEPGQTPELIGTFCE